MIPSPYLLYLGALSEPGDAKTSRGVAAFRPADCVDEFRHDEGTLTHGLPRMTFAEARAAGARTLILGVAVAGGVLPPAILADAIAATEAGLNIAAGLHHRLRDAPELAAAAERHGVRLFDVRDPPAGLRVGTGRPRAGRRLLTVGTDCSVGKMYTALAIAKALRARGDTADFRATGQTGILIAGAGVPIDAVVADFIAGGIEALSPARDDHGWDVIEGQGSLFHPSFAGVSLGLLHGAQPDALVLCHDPTREHLRGLPHFPLPDLGECLARNIEAARLTNPAVRCVGVSLNTSRLPPDRASAVCDDIAGRLGLPCVDPVRHNLAPVLQEMDAWFERSTPALAATG